MSTSVSNEQGDSTPNQPVTACTISCQTQDWSLHKTLCKKFSNLSPRPSPDRRLGILFPPDSTSPRLVWVAFVPTKVPKNDGLFDAPCVDEYLTYGPNDRFDPEQLLIEPVRIPRAQKVNHTLAVYMRDNFGSDGSKPTQSVLSITGGKMKHEWKGPLVVLALEGESVPQSTVLKVGGMTFDAPAGRAFRKNRDITLKDLRIVLDYFFAYPYDDLTKGLHLTDKFGNLVFPQ